MRDEIRWAGHIPVLAIAGKGGMQGESQLLTY